MPATLTKAMLNDLHKGCASIKLLSEIATSAGLTADFSAADEIFTLAGTFKINQADHTLTPIKIDQLEQQIDTDTEKGDMTIAGDVPSKAEALLDYFFDHNAAAAHTSITVTSEDGTFSGKGYKTTVKKTMCAVLVTSESKQTAILFPRVQFLASYNNDDMNMPQIVRLTGSVLSPTFDGAEDFYPLKKD